MSEAVPFFGDALAQDPQDRAIGPGPGWPAAGSDLRKAPAVGLGYGLIFALPGMRSCWRRTWFAPPVASSWPAAAGAGFLLVGPILAVGLYEVSRRLAANEAVSLGLALSAFKRNTAQIALMGLLLLLFLLFWIRLATLIFALFFSQNPPDPRTTSSWTSSSRPRRIPFLAVGVIVGAVLAALVFAISARCRSPCCWTARRPTSSWPSRPRFTAVRLNLAPMAVWAALIVLFTGAGLVTAYLGLIVALPLIGHDDRAANPRTLAGEPGSIFSW